MIETETIKQLLPSLYRCSNTTTFYASIANSTIISTATRDPGDSTTGGSFISYR